jgi:hypothetical protein
VSVAQTSQHDLSDEDLYNAAEAGSDAEAVSSDAEEASNDAENGVATTHRKVEPAGPSDAQTCVCTEAQSLHKQ